MISSPGCLCLMGCASGLITTRFWIIMRPERSGRSAADRSGRYLVPLPVPRWSRPVPWSYRASPPRWLTTASRATAAGSQEAVERLPAGAIDETPVDEDAGARYIHDALLRGMGREMTASLNRIQARRQWCRGHTDAGRRNSTRPRCACTNCTAIAPSPTAVAQRLVEPERTSPAAKMPGTLVSSR
jgi:hypothetical protein